MPLSEASRSVNRLCVRCGTGFFADNASARLCPACANYSTTIEDLTAKLKLLGTSQEDRLAAHEIVCQLMRMWQRQEFALRDSRLDGFFQEAHRIGKPEPKPLEPFRATDWRCR